MKYMSDVMVSRAKSAIEGKKDHKPWGFEEVKRENDQQ
jgi:hypothetical protein